MAIYDSQTQNKSTRNSRNYRDIDLDFARNPVTNDVNVVEDVIAVKRSVRNLVQTNFYERPFQPGTGANLRGRLFEPNDAITRIGLRNDIKRCISNHEPRVVVNGIDIQDDSDNNSYRITLNFTIKNFDTQDSVDIELRRLR